MVRVRTECRHGFTALTVVLVTDARGLASGALALRNVINQMGLRLFASNLKPCS
jgi:hypothetical protein